MSDDFDSDARAETHPDDWQNPASDGIYNLVAVGGGTAGIIAALGAAGWGGRAALVERNLLGGDCLNFGCVPSKALLRSARGVFETRAAHEVGVRGAAEATADFPAIMERMRRLRAKISRHDAAERFRGLGVDVYFGQAKFTGPDRIDVGGRTLRFRRCVIATGSEPVVPEAPGWADIDALTNESVLSLRELPRRMIVVGGGPIGCEYAQAFQRFGSDVTLFHRGDRLLPRDDPEASALIERTFRDAGITVHLRSKLVQAERTSAGEKRVRIEGAAGAHTWTGDAVLAAIGRRPRWDGLNLEAAGVKTSPRGVAVNDFLQTANPHIYAAGDIVGGPQFTHAADAMARACLQNAFFFGRKRLSELVIPWTTYTDPEVAQVGLTPAAASERNIEIDSYREDLTRVDRAVLDGDEQGFAVVHCRRGSGRIVGATIVARHAGDLLAPLTLLLTQRQSLGALANTIHCYPTQSEVLKRIADQFNRIRLTPRVAWWLKRILQWR